VASSARRLGSTQAAMRELSGATPEAHCSSGCTDDWCVPLGIIVHVVGSVGINIGQNLQALGLERLAPEMAQKKCSACHSTLWVVGMVTFAISSVVTFGALALASATILVPLESVQFVVNIAFGKFVRKKVITWRMMAGTVILIVGIALVVAFGTKEEGCFDGLEPLKVFWQREQWLVYFGATFVLFVITYIVWRFYADAKNRGKPLKYGRLIEPLAFTISAALFGGGQMIVHTKMLAEVIELTASSGSSAALSDWLFWVELLLTGIFGGYWLFRLSQCLALYDPLFIIPLMQTAFIIFGAISAGIFYDEFPKLAKAEPLKAWNIFFYVAGLLVTVVGLSFLAPPASDIAEVDASSVEMPAASVAVEGVAVSMEAGKGGGDGSGGGSGDDDAAADAATDDTAAMPDASTYGAGAGGANRRRSFSRQVTFPIAKINKFFTKP